MNQARDQAAERSPYVPLVACAATLALGFWCAANGGLWSERGRDGVLIAMGPLVTAALPLSAILLAAAGMGGPILRWLRGPSPTPETSRFGRVGLQCGLGLMAFMILAWLIAWAGFLNRSATLSLCGVGIALLVMQLFTFRGASATIPIPAPPMSVIVAMPVLGIALFACACPPGSLWRIEAWGYDVTSYHLQIPREWLEAGRMIPLRHNIYSFLPGLAESTYAHVGALFGNVCDAVYATQLLHLASGVIAGMIVVGIVETQLNATRNDSTEPGATQPRTAGLLAAAVLLAMPWTVITGTLAYNEMFVLLFAAAALHVTLDTRLPMLRAAIVSGALSGAATLAKLPAGPMVSLPIMLAWCHRGWSEKRTDVRLRFSVAPAMGLACLLMLAPYFARNHAWTGNPVFPFAANTLGMGHWTSTEVARWNAGHQADGSPMHRLSELGRRWLCNPGFGAFGGMKSTATREIAVFDLEWGVPVFWPLAIAAAVALGFAQRTRRPAIALGLMLACQLVFWLVCTHLQSRFLVPTLLPGVVLLGISVDRFKGPLRPIPVLLMVSLAISLTLQTHIALVEQLFFRAPPWRFAALLPPWEEPIKPDEPGLFSHPINTKVGPGAKVLLIADAARLLYLKTPVSYHTAFDREPLGDILREADMNTGAVTRELRRRGFTHVWSHFAELNRLRESYGYDPDVTETQILRLARDAGWRVVMSHDRAVALYELPVTNEPPVKR